MFTYCYFKYFLGAWLIFVSPFLILVALSTPQESFLFAVEYWGDFLFWLIMYLTIGLRRGQMVVQ